MKKKYWLMLILIALVVGFLSGRATIGGEEVVRHVKGETVYGSLNPDFLTVKKEFKGDIQFLPYIFWKGDTVRINEVEYISTTPDTAKIVEDFLVKREYQFTVFDNENGKMDARPVVQYNRLQTFDYTFTPIKTVITKIDKPVFTPFLSASYNTFGIAGIGGGFFYNNTGIEYNYLYQPINNSSGHMIGLKIKF